MVKLCFQINIVLLLTFIGINSRKTQTCRKDIIELLTSTVTNCLICYESDLHISFKTWHFWQSQNLNRFPIDPITRNYVREVRNAIFSIVKPTPLEQNVVLAAVSHGVLTEILDMHPNISKTGEFLDFVSGNKLLPGGTPLCHRYGGHQFGVWAGQLGDGRAHMLGEYVNNQGFRYELQIKGSGLTPYSRRGDGRAVIRSSVREFLASEAMYYLGKLIKV